MREPEELTLKRGRRIVEYTVYSKCSVHFYISHTFYKTSRADLGLKAVRADAAVPTLLVYFEYFALLKPANIPLFSMSI